MGLNFPGSGYAGSSHPHSYHPYHQHPAYYQHQQSMFSSSYPHASSESLIGSSGGKHDVNEPKNPMSRDCGVPIPASKPKIWSLADTVASKTPPLHSAVYMNHQQQQRHQQQMSQQPHPMQQLQQMSSLIPTASQNTSNSTNNTMMSGSYSTNPYTRGPSTAYENFLGAMATTNNMPPYSTNSNTPNNTNNSNSHPSIITPNNSHHLSPITPPTTAQPPNAHHTHHQQQRIPSNPNLQRGMGFPEAQPDTPPQTPPNMKVPNVQLATNLLLTATQAHMTATCHNINSNHHNVPNSQNSNNPYGTPYSRSYDNSPRDENSVGSSCSSASGSSHDPDPQTYKAIFKR